MKQQRTLFTKEVAERGLTIIAYKLQTQATKISP